MPQTSSPASHVQLATACHFLTVTSNTAGLAFVRAMPLPRQRGRLQPAISDDNSGCLAQARQRLKTEAWPRTLVPSSNQELERPKAWAVT